MTDTRNLPGGSAQVDLRGLQEGTHPLVLGDGSAPLVIDPDTGTELLGFRFEGELVWRPQDRRVRGSLHGQLSVACDRCLTPVARDLSAEVDLRLELVVPGSGEAEAFDDAEAGVVRIASEQAKVDLADSFRRAALLEVPIKNVCREECQGLCPRCGTNRNQASCDCDTERRDPRWDGLRGLTFRSEEEE